MSDGGVMVSRSSLKLPCVWLFVFSGVSKWESRLCVFLCKGVCVTDVVLVQVDCDPATAMEGH